MKLSKISTKKKLFKMEGGYKGVEFTGNLSMALGTVEALQSNQMDSMIDALRDVILGWNLTDDQEEALEVTSDNLRLVPTDFINAMVLLMVGEMGQVPNS